MDRGHALHDFGGPGTIDVLTLLLVGLHFKALHMYVRIWSIWVLENDEFGS